jgi:chemotaxis receptor (MCP) glutamine deamidase CheD
VEVRTLLGSCVAVCLFDPVAKVGGMNHILLPDGVPHGSDRYAGPAIDALVRRTIELGGDPRRLRAKLFGGAHCPSEFAELPEIGRLNADAVKGRLGELGIPVVAERLGGEQAVRIRFSPDTGRVLVEPLDPAERRRILAAEKANLSRLRRAASPAR